MACYHPMIGIPDYKPGTTEPYRTKNGKIRYRIVSKDILRSDMEFKDCVQIPCGKCIGCRLEYSRQWANRCMLELEYHDVAWFLTLTYDEDHVPETFYPDKSTGEAFSALTLQKRDLQLFWKRLRKAFPDDHIRYFACGEYGSETFRPHYHAIVYGLHLDDLEFYKIDAQGFPLYNSPSLSRCWSVDGSPIGYAVVGNVTWDSCAYVARYVTKKLMGPDAKFYDQHNLQRPFTVMSRKPGIARQYFDDHPDLFDYEYINISTEKGGKKFRPPAYFERLLDEVSPEESEARKEARRKIAEDLAAARLANSTLEPFELSQVAERNHEARTKSLTRSVL